MAESPHFIRISHGNYAHESPKGPHVKNLALNTTKPGVDGGGKMDALEVVVGRGSAVDTGFVIRATKLDDRGFFSFKRPRFKVEIGEVKTVEVEGQEKKVFEAKLALKGAIPARTEGSARRRMRNHLQENPRFLIEQGVIFKKKPVEKLASVTAALPVDPAPVIRRQLVDVGSSKR